MASILLRTSIFLAKTSSTPSFHGFLLDTGDAVIWGKSKLSHAFRFWLVLGATGVDIFEIEFEKSRLTAEKFIPHANLSHQKILIENDQLS